MAVHLSTIRYIVKVAETGNVTQAAQQLFVSQPALSQSIQRFEQEIGMPVFRRTKGGLTLTPAGEIVAREGLNILEAEKRMEADLKRLQKSSNNTVRIGAASSYQRFMLTEVFTRLQMANPEMQIHVSNGFSHTFCSSLEKGELDFALAFEPIPEHLQAMPIFKEEVFLAVPPQAKILSRLKESPGEDGQYAVADLAACKDENFILYPEERRLQKTMMAETAKAGFMPRGSLISYSTEAANSMAFTGAGLTFVPAVAMLLSSPLRRPVYFRLQEGGFYRTLYFIYRKGKEYEALTEMFLSEFREQSRRMRTPGCLQMLIS